MIASSGIVAGDAAFWATPAEESSATDATNVPLITHWLPTPTVHPSQTRELRCEKHVRAKIKCCKNKEFAQ